MYWSLLEAISRDLERMSVAERPSGQGGEPCRRMPVNLYQSDDAITVSAELPGVAPEDIELTVEDGVLSLVAERKGAELSENESAVVQEQVQGKLVRRVRLPYPVDAGEISANMQQGVLRVTLPKRADAKPRRIDVTAG